jgi:ABC-type sugar transport system permease subunit
MNPIRYQGRLRSLRDSAARWLLVLPALAGLLIFSYYPNLETMWRSLYRWEGSTVLEFRGGENFIRAFTADPAFWQSFVLILILLVANLLKMWPSIFTAIVLHRLRAERWQYAYRVLLVVPMVIPGLVTLLLWKGFFDANVGLLNTFLNASGGMHLLAGLDRVLPVLASTLSGQHLVAAGQPWWAWVIALPCRFMQMTFGGPLGFVLAMLGVLALGGGITQVRRYWLLLPAGIGVALVAWGPGLTEIAIRAAGVLGLGWWAGHRSGGIPTTLAAGCRALLALGLFLAALTQVWPDATGAFATGHPAWLGNSHLVIPAMILWGFPWIGTIGVLIYLAGLQNISQEVYEAAELDGVGFWGKIFRIEVPLLMTQVRINLTFLTIGTLTDYGFYLVLFGPDGGPANAAMVPGLYIFRTAFIEGHLGYACALGMLLFLVILYLTAIYQKHVAVEK